MNKIIMTLFVPLLFFSAPHLAMGDLYGDLTGNYSNTSLTFSILSCYWLVAIILLYDSPPLKIKLGLIIGGIIGSITVAMIGETVLLILLYMALFGGLGWMVFKQKSKSTNTEKPN